MSEKSASRIVIALRAAMLAKSALDIMDLEPSLAKLQLVQVAKFLRELDEALRRAA